MLFQLPSETLSWADWGLAGLVIGTLFGLVLWLLRDLRSARRELTRMANEHRDELMQVVSRNTQVWQEAVDVLRELKTSLGR